ncbi:MAG: endonuclease III [Elusimicrobia bacterium]|nr:endonuclease III [Elusimicrobiota bacterium]
MHDVVRILKREIKRWKVPVVGVVAQRTRDPFQVLVSTLLSLRTKDETTERASTRLFAVARTPRAMTGMRLHRLERLIYPVCFYRNKARTLKSVSRSLLDEHGGRVPDDLDELLKLKGVGRKTANLVVTLGFGKPGICVDTHVHRIMNRLGYVRTRTPDETEAVLRGKLPRAYWNVINDLLVTYGQNLCRPVSPWCSRCAIRRFCDRVGVVVSR